MNCQQILDLLVDYLDGELDPAMAGQLETHLKQCPECVEFIDTYCQTSTICRQALSVDMPAPHKASLFQFLRDQLQSPPS